MSALAAAGAERNMRAAAQRVGAEPGPLQHRRGEARVPLGASVRAAGKRDLGGTEAEVVGSAAFDQRQRLQRLDGGARIDGALDIAEL